ncbi:MAG: SIS domain-containing protein [Candidatus Magasanikbacteria bacterium]|nr:SIS domain-containing protein [Candidatus Magasanikbacteria bacterium]
MLDNKEKISQLDSKNMLGSIELFGQQIEEVLAQAKKIKIPSAYKKVTSIVVLGMGGSALGAHVIKSIFFKNLAVPVEIINGYQIPSFISEKTLVIASSYSGSTEEVVSAAGEAKKKKAKILVICSGGKLGEWAQKNKIPSLIFSTNNNPCGSPRMGLGYSVFGQIALLVQVGLLQVSSSQIKNCLQVIAHYNSVFGVGAAQEKNRAKQLAANLSGKSVWYVASEHLSGNVHIAANQMNENAKRFAGYFIVPELNHHLMEGMLYPEANKNGVTFLMVESGLYDSRVQKRYEITKKILDKNNIGYAVYVAQEKNKLAQACEVLILSSYISFYSAMLQGIDPTAIPFVDFFKAELKK